MKTSKKNKIIISLSIIIPLILIVVFIAVWNHNPSFQMFFSGKEIISYTYEEYDGGSNEIFISIKNGQLYFDVFKRNSATVHNGLLGELGESESAPERVFTSYSLDGYEPKGSAMVYIIEQRVTDGRIDSSFRTMLIQKAAEDATETTQKIDNYNVTSQILEHKGNKYQLIIAERIINHEMNNFGLEDMKEFINQINK